MTNYLNDLNELLERLKIKEAETVASDEITTISEHQLERVVDNLIDTISKTNEKLRYNYTGETKSDLVKVLDKVESDLEKIRKKIIKKIKKKL
jgi:hypothetical protein